ncbi:heparan-alpha-glucosaminide N-acetyltransferase-like [Schistocerca piceifrons]|uniref:heparan-alpha-glucosaminide N-acetyltransferase-like n=1 Tax=Schistocerca piceifrons TaxID=274613 RepID=UPI001F5EF297|nr:heparan-alpha-glucosaminide N-acetyltransferase-like [Schistocerca piceifrons]
MSWIEDPGVDVFRGLNLRDLGVDQAFVNVTSQIKGTDKLYLYSLSEECYKCPFTLLTDPNKPQETLKISTQRRYTWRVLTSVVGTALPASDYSAVLCETSADLGEFGVYELQVKPQGGNSSQATCEVHTILEPVNIYLPLVICILGLLVLWIVSAGIPFITNRWFKKNRIITPTTQQMDSLPRAEKDQNQQQQAKQRLKSLDTFRGISIVLMIFVNDGAGKYWFLEHTTWNGLNVADVLFPWFMWIMGVCVPISVRSQLKRNTPRCKIIAGILRRSCILFLLGMMINTSGGYYKLETIRIFGVLQRFGIVYFVVATLMVAFTCRNFNPPKTKLLAAMQDIIILLPLWVVAAAAIAGNCAITFFFEVPGCPKGYMGPGGIHENGQFEDCVGGAVGYIDRLVLGVDHLYQHPTAQAVYGSGPFDPEGLVGCITSIFQVILGVQAGTTLILFWEWKSRILRWLSWGTICGIIGAILCLASKEDGWIPVNKNLWSLSFVLVTSCFAFYLLSFCYFLIDVKHWWSGAPFFYPGMNATIMYVGHEIGHDLFPWHWAIGRMNTHFMLLIESIWGTALWVIIAVWLYHIKFFLAL